ncbi:MAG: TolC family protein [Cyanobacteriota bacterium]|nr:TolC family protein [Cyanobacteriota bacterium]
MPSLSAIALLALLFPYPQALARTPVGPITETQTSEATASSPVIPATPPNAPAAPIAGASRDGSARALIQSPAGPAATPTEAAPASSGSTRAEHTTAQAVPTALSLEQVLERGLSVSLDLERGRRQQARDRALVDLNAAARLPQLALVGLGSYTEVGTSVGLVTNLPTLGDLSLPLGGNGYAQLQNSFANLGLVLDVNLLPLRQGAELAASRAGLKASGASQRESERQVRFNLISAYRQLQLQQGLVPIWQQALQASTALERDAQAILRRGLAPRIDLLRSRALRANDAQGLAESQAQLLASRQQLATLLNLPPEQAPLAADPIRPQAGWALDLAATLEQGLRERPLLQALQSQQQAQRQQAKAARSARLPSLSLLLGAGYSVNDLAVPVLNGAGSVGGPLGGLNLAAQQQPGNASGSFYDWGVALLLRQSLYDGGRSASGAAVAERQRELLQADEALARRRIREEISSAWASLQAAPAAIEAAQEAVRAGERALRDAQLRYRAQVETITEVLLVQRELQAARAALLTALTRQALDRAILERETGRNL